MLGWPMAQQAPLLPGSGVGGSAGAGSPVTDYVASVIIYTFLAAVLVTLLLLSAFLILNLGLMSKRPEDRTGGRSPSDPAFLKSNLWPEEAYEKNILPAEESDEEPDDEEDQEEEKRVA